MKAQDLRIGNYFETWDGKQEEVWLLNDRTVNGFGCGEDAVEKFLPKPIPLDESWLLRFGAERKHSFEVVWKLHNITFTFDKDHSRVYIEIGGKLIFLNYVHQLQNYFALTGSELVQS